MEHLSDEERLKELGLFSLEKRGFQGIPYCSLLVPEGAYKTAGEGLLKRTCSDRTRGNGLKMRGGKFRLDVREKFLTVREMRHWRRWLREVLDAPCLEAFKSSLGGALGNLV